MFCTLRDTHDGWFTEGAYLSACFLYVQTLTVGGCPSLTATGTATGVLGIPWF